MLAGRRASWLPHRESVILKMSTLATALQRKILQALSSVHIQGFFFVPLIASTFGQQHPDFLRFSSWHYSRVPLDHSLLVRGD
jgi:hypothetical protein